MSAGKKGTATMADLSEVGARPRDTSPEAWEVYVRLIRQMTPEQRLLRACDLSGMVRQLALAGIRQRHPNASDDGVRKRFAAITLGPELARKVYGWDSEMDGY